MLEASALRDCVIATLERIAPRLSGQRFDSSASLRDQIDLDSIDWLNFLGILEESTGLTIRPADYAKLTTLDALVAYLAARQADCAAHAQTVPSTMEHRLADGRLVTIRPIRPDDAPRVQHFLDATSAESRYSRFHKWVAAPSNALVHFLTDVDERRCGAYVCTAFVDGQEAVVGEARYVASPQGGVCELGILIEDDWRKTGIAGLLMETVLHAAREHGYRWMEGLVLAYNAPMLRFAHALGFEVRHVAEDPTTVRILLDLQPARTAAPGGAG